MTSTSQVAGAASSSTQEFVVRLPTNRQKKLSMLKFATSLKVDFTKLGETTVKMERENNLREFKTANDLDLMPKFGAGSEFGREQKEEARRKKYGIVRKRYNPEAQPWLMKIGTGKQARKFKGVREGTVSENTSYYIFTQCSDGAFEATPVEEWYNFTPVIKYKYLNSDEAEEEFLRRDKIMNYFNVMLKKRINNDGDKEADGEEIEKTAMKKSKKKGKDFLLTDLDDWADLSDDDEDDDEEEGKDKDKKDDGDEDSKGKKKKKKGAKVEVKKKKNAKSNSDDEAIEESDEGDFDDREVDYMTGSDSSLSGVEDRDKMDKYEEKGVAEEKGLRKLIDSEEESDEEEETNKEGENEEDKEEAAKKDGKDSDSESSNSSSASDSDIEKDENLSSALFMQKKNGEKKKNSDKAPSRSATPNSIENEEKLTTKKRKLEPELSSSKRSRTDSPIITSQSSSEGLNEDSIRRYLMRKPMTTKDLLQKFKSKKINMTTEQMASTIAQLLKRINPERQYVNEVLYLSIKTPKL